MKKIISTEKKPIKMWLDDIEENTLGQAKNLANLPFVFKHIAIMPDSHYGYGMPIGGIMATQKVIVPNAVGSDIGCGMCAVKTSLTKIDTETLKKIMGEIRQAVPVGFKKHNEEQSYSLMPDFSGIKIDRPIIYEGFDNALKSLGTLGSGNHFIEIQKGSDGFIWIMIHSGSRNLGLQVAKHYNQKAIEINEKYFSSVAKEQELAFLPLDSKEGDSYVKEMNYCVEFALVNRELMMERVKNIFWHILGKESVPIGFAPMINIAHNYAVLENHCSTCIDNQSNDNPLHELLSDDETVSKAQDSLNGYRPFVHSCGGLLLKKEDSVLKISPSLIDALEQMTHMFYSLTQGPALKHNHLSSLNLCECESFSEIDKALNISENKFGLGFSHLFGVEKDYRKWDRILGRIFLGFSAYKINCRINKDTHSISQVMVHRKGATKATEDTVGIIPGSQGTKSYIVQGKGNPDSFNSCSHGAGRKMGRKQAQRELNLEEEIKKLDEQGIIHGIRGIKQLDEAPGSYKDIDEVMANQTDLAEIKVELTPLGCIKG